MSHQGSEPGRRGTPNIVAGAHGRPVIVVQTELRDDSAALAAQVTQAQAVLPGG
jgi:hypothetical protein